MTARVQPLHSKDLHGRWSRDAMYGPGSQSDEIVVFRPNGSGFMVYENPVPFGADLFRWTLEGPSQVRLVGDKWLDVTGEARRIQEYPSRLDGVYAIQVQLEKTESSRWMRVLRFSPPPWSGIPDAFGYVDLVDDTAEPDFSWIETRP